MSFFRLILFLVLAVAALYFLAPRYFPFLFSPASSPGAEYRNVRIGDKIFRLETADTEDKRIKGLSGRDAMPADQGMIFIFDKAGNYGITMRGMRFNLDIIWVKNKQIVDIVENAKPMLALEEKVYYPVSDADAVIELNAGTVERLNINQGDRLSW